MKTGQEFFKRNNQLADLSKTLHIDPATFIEKASKVRDAIKKRFAAQLTGKKTCGNMPGTFCVLKIIQNSEKGVDPRTLKQMTGFKKKKVHKILYKLFKHGVIRIEVGGLYAGVKGRNSGSLG